MPVDRLRPDAAADGQETPFNGLGSVFQMLQNATAAPPTTGSRTMRFTSPNMNATVTVQSRTFGPGGARGTPPGPNTDAHIRDLQEIEHIHQ